MIIRKAGFLALVKCLVAFVLLLSGTAGAQHSTFVSPDPQAFGRFGWSVSPAGDVDGDGIPDALIGAHTEDAGGAENSGRTYVISGSDGSVIRTLVSPNPEADGRFGWTISSAGDVTSDGVLDVLVGVPMEDAGGFEDSGRVYMLSGSDGSVIHTFESPDATEGGTFGRSVAAIDDVDGDQIPDVLIGAAFEPVGALAGSGRVYVFSGLDGGLLYTLESPNAEVEGQFGSSVAALGDLDGDGTRDMLIGAHAEDTGGIKDSGRAYVFSGSDGSLLHTLESPNAEASGLFGASGATAGDVNGDGVSDMLIGAFDEDAGGVFRSGRAYMFSGLDGSLLHTLESPNIELDGLFGWSVSAVGDTNGDGTPDVVVGAPLETAEGFGFSGRAYVFSGSDGSLLHTLVSPNAEQLGVFSRSLSAAGDIDGDGVSDILVGASDEDAGGFFDSGRVYIFNGRTGVVLPIERHPLPQPVDHLEAPFPNPFSGQAHLRLRVVHPQQVQVAVYDLLGQRVALLSEGFLAPGDHVFILHGAGLPSGVYHVRAIGEFFTHTRQVVLLK